MTDVPSNLIPTRISQLPEYTGSSQEGYLPYVYEGVTYKVRFSGVASAGEVPPSRTLTAGTGLTGGGDLSADRVFAITDGGVGADQLDTTGVVAGVYGDASNVPTITVDANGRVSDVSTTPIVALGYVPESRVITAGDGLSGGGNLAGDRSFSVNFSSVAPSPLGSASAGVANVAAREDHVHPAVDLSDMTETQGTLPLGRGGTGASLSPIAGAVAYSTGTHMSLTPVGVAGQVLVSGGVGAPYWLTLTGTGTVTSVNIDGGTSGLNFIGGPITTAGVFTLQDPGFIQFDTAYGASRNTGRLWWNDDDNAKTLMLGGEGSDVDIKVGEQNYFRVKASAAITKGQVVMFTGTVGASGGLQGAPATGLTEVTASYIMGVAAEDIPLNGWGYVTEFGLIRQLDTTAFSDGDILYYDPSVAGGLRVGAPPAPAAKAEIAAVVLSATNGSIFVRATPHFSIEQLNDVETAAASDLDLLEFNGASGVWRHRDPQTINVGGATNVLNGAANQIVYQTGSGSSSFIAAPSTANTFLEWSGSAFQWSSNPLGTVTSVDVSGGTTGLTASGGPITSSGTITLGGTLGVANGGTGATTAAGALTSLGAYPASNPDGYTTNTGTVTSVAATAGTGISVSGSPITTSGTLTITNTAPDQTVTLTQGGTTTITGTYPNFTISSADQYDGTVTSVAATVPTGFTVGGSPITTSGTLAIGFDTGYSLPTDAEQANWDTAYADRYKWDGGSSGLVAATGRTSLGLGTSAVLDAGVAGGVATLDGGGTVPTSQLPAAVLGALKYQGTWNASTNSPTLTSSVGTQGYYYVVSVAGTTNLDGISDWAVGDWAIFNGSTWDKIDNTDAVTSVNGYTGTVVLDYADVGAPSTTGTGASGTWNIDVTGNAANVTGTVAVANGGTGATTAAGARTNLGAANISGDTFTGTVNFPSSSSIASNIVGFYPTSYMEVGSAFSQYGGNFEVSGNATFYGDLKSSVFYDRNNTAYYLDPASTGTSLTTAGSVGIGTSSPSSLLHVQRTLAANDWNAITIANAGSWSSATNNAALINVTDGGGTVGKFGVTYDSSGRGAFVVRNLFSGGYGASGDVFYVRGDGNVGIGTASPTNKLDVTGVIRSVSATFGNSDVIAETTASTGTGYSRFILKTTDREWRLINDASTSGSPFLLYDATAAATRLLVNSSGRVGVNSNAPATILHASDPTNAVSSTTITRGVNHSGLTVTTPYNGDDMVGIFFATGTTTAGSHWTGITGNRTDSTSHWGTHLSFYTHGDDFSAIDNADERLRITGNGRVGIGTTSPAGILSVASGSSTGTSIGSWSSNYSVFGPNAGSATGAALGIGYNTATDTAEIVSIAPSVAWKNMRLAAVTLDLETISGRVQTNQSFRAPIFYDSNNTAYYLDPASTGTSLTTAGSVGIGTSSPAAKLHLSDTGPCELIIEADTDNVTETDNSRIIFKQDGGAVVSRVGYANGSNSLEVINQYAENLYLGTSNSVDLTINSAGNITAAVDLRAPRFYDSNDTAYYVDPNGTSNLNTLFTREDVGGGSATAFVYIAPTVYHYWTKIANLTGADAAATLLITSKDDVNYVNNVNAILTLSRFNNSTASAKIETLGGCDESIFVRIDDNNDVWLQVTSTWSSNIRWRVINKVGSPTVYYASLTQQTTTPANSTQISYGQAMRGSQGAMSSAVVSNIANRIYGGLTTLSDVRAPIFYDSNNTGFFIDLSSTGQAIRARGDIYLGSNSSGKYLRLGGSGGTSSFGNVTVTNGNLHIDAENNFEMYLNHYSNADVYVGNGGGFLQAYNSLRAPIFYDSNNTAYYANPSGTSVLNTSIEFGTTPNVGGGGGRIIRSIGSPYSLVTDFGADNTGWRYGIAKNVSGTRTVYFYVQDNGAVVSLGDMRAPIFYDSDNTAYFVNPASGAKLFDLNIEGSGNKYLYINSTSGNEAMVRYIGSTGSSWYVGKRTAAQLVSTGDFHFFSEAAAQTVAGVDTAGNIFALSSARAPIFYDSNNTGYYCDPNSDSIFYKFQNINQRVAYDRLWGNYPSITVYNTTDQGPQTDFRIHGIGGANGGDFAVRLLVDGRVESLTDMAAPIFYDSGNTAFYVNPADGTSAVFAGTVQFAATTQSKLNLYTTTYQIGIQASTQYYRSNSRFSWFRGGVHSNTENDAGTGGTVAMTLDSSSNLTVTGNVTAFSDIRVKDNVEQIGGALDRLQAIRGVTYTRNDLEDKERRYAGVIAQEIEKVLPEAIFESDDRKAVDYNATIGLLIEAIKELKAEVETLKKG